MPCYACVGLLLAGLCSARLLSYVKHHAWCVQLSITVRQHHTYIGIQTLCSVLHTCDSKGNNAASDIRPEQTIKFKILIYTDYLSPEVCYAQVQFQKEGKLDLSVIPLLPALLCF